jgi:four helix bundle protein
MASENVIKVKSCEFARKIARMSRVIRKRGDAVLARQVLRSGTSIGANVEEAHAAQTRREFHSKMTISFKEATKQGVGCGC